MSEPLQIRWRRRVVSIPTVLGVTAIVVFGAPILITAAVLSDLLRGRRRFPAVRVYLFVLQYLINDSVEILLAPLLWVQAGFGSRLGSDVSQQRHRDLQNWSVRNLAERADLLLGLPVELIEGSKDELGEGPLIVISRHVSLFDASLPGLIFERLDYKVKGVIMAELLADPGFDLIYGRTGSVFIPRDNGQAAVRAIEKMAENADERTALAIFPEGRLFRSSVLGRQLARLQETDPERAERLGGLRHMLPPRPGGFNALLDAVPEADVVLLEHHGLDRLRRMADLVKVVPANKPVTVALRRFPRADIPTETDARTAWLDRLWLDIDADLNRERAGQ